MANPPPLPDAPQPTADPAPKPGKLPKQALIYLGYASLALAALAQILSLTKPGLVGPVENLLKIVQSIAGQ